MSWNRCCSRAGTKNDRPGRDVDRLVAAGEPPAPRRDDVDLVLLVRVLGVHGPGAQAVRPDAQVRAAQVLLVRRPARVGLGVAARGRDGLHARQPVTRRRWRGSATGSGPARCCRTPAATRPVRPPRGSGIRCASSGRATLMSVRATKCPRQWCTPPPNPLCGGRSVAVMSNPGSAPMARGSVPEACERTWTISPRRDRQAEQVDVLERLPGHPRDGRVDPHHLLDGRPTELGPLGQQRPLVGVPQERLQGEAELVARRLHPGEGEEHQADAQLPLVERLVVLGGDQGADEVVARIARDGRRPPRRRTRSARPGLPRSAAGPGAG